MGKKIKQWLKGQVVLQCNGWGRDRLLNICKKNDILIQNIKVIDDGYIFQVSAQEYKQVLHFNEKIKTTLNIKDKWGLPYFFYKYRKRKIFILCFLLFVMGIYIFSNFIWNISINGNETYTKEQLAKDINDNFVTIGTPKSEINCNELEKELRYKYTSIAWISCQIKGTNLIINLEETVPTEEIITMDEPCNIVAYKDAIVTEIVINSGTRVTNLGDEVKKNDVLITGVVNIKNEYDELIETNYTTARGVIWGIVEYSYLDQFNTEINEKTYTGSSKTHYDLSVINNIIKLPLGDNKFKSYDTVVQTNNIKLFDNLYLPFGILKETYKEYTISTVNLTDEEATAMANERLVLYIDNLKKKGVSILENNVTIGIVDGVCTASGSIKCKEVISIPSELEIIQEGEQP